MLLSAGGCRKMNKGVLSDRFRKIDPIPFILLIISVGTFICLHHVIGVGLFDSSVYNSYVRQAFAWRNGMLWLPENVKWLELAVYHGHYYVSFPPVPTLVFLPLTYIFGENTPDNFILFLYFATSCELIYFFLRSKEYKRIAAGCFAFFLCFSGCVLSICLKGGVWLQAQMLGFLLMVLSVGLMMNDKPTGSLICYAFAVGCRPFDALFGLVLIPCFYIKHKKQGESTERILDKLFPGLIVGFLIAVAYGVFNYIRFGDVFEFGHNYLPEFSSEGSVQFSTDYITKNLRNFVLRMPFSSKDNGMTLELEKFGFCMFIANPMLTALIVMSVIDIIKKRFSVSKGILLGVLLLHLLLLLMHRTFGGFQFGARYTVDLLPYVFLYFLLSRPRRFTGGEAVLYSFSVLFGVYGAIVINR